MELQLLIKKVYTVHTNTQFFGSIMSHCLRLWHGLGTLLNKCISILICRDAQSVSLWSRLQQNAHYIDWSRIQ